MNKTMQELAESLPQSENTCVYCGTPHPDIAPITGPDAWHIIPDKILGFVSVCPECWVPCECENLTCHAENKCHSLGINKTIYGTTICNACTKNHDPKDLK